jgi:anti-anti-sigma factor
MCTGETMHDEQLDIEPPATADDSNRFVVEIDRRDAECTLALAGELDVASAAMLEASVREACEQEPSALALDLHDLSFMDSSGLRVVLLANELCQEREIELSLVPGMPQVQRIFEVTGLLETLHFRPARPRGGDASRA